MKYTKMETLKERLFLLMHLLKFFLEFFGYKLCGHFCSLVNRRHYHYSITFDSMSDFACFTDAADVFFFKPEWVPSTLVASKNDVVYNADVDFSHRLDISLALRRSGATFQKTISQINSEAIKQTVSSLRDTNPKRYSTFHWKYKALIEAPHKSGWKWKTKSQRAEQRRSRSSVIRTLPFVSIGAIALLNAAGALSNYDFVITLAVAVTAQVVVGVFFNFRKVEAMRLLFESPVDARTFLKMLRTIESEGDSSRTPSYSPNFGSVSLLTDAHSALGVNRALSVLTRNSYRRERGEPTQKEIYSALMHSVSHGEFNRLDKKFKRLSERLPEKERAELQALLLVEDGSRSG